MPRGRIEQELLPRFLSKVKEVESGCQEWQSTLSKWGYGKFWYKGKQIPAHRMSYSLFVGNIDGKNVLHACDNRKCVNVNHLFLGSTQDNISDMDKKGRRGTKCKITEKQADEIKQLLSHGFSQQKIGKMFNINQTTVSRIKLNKIKLFKI